MGDFQAFQGKKSDRRDSAFGELQQAIDGQVTPCTDEHHRVIVEVSQSEQFDRFVGYWFSGLEARARMNSCVLNPLLTLDGVKRYFTTLIISRINFVNRKTLPADGLGHAILDPSDVFLAIPKVLSAFLEGLGPVLDHRNGISYIPSYVGDGAETLGRLEAQNVALAIREITATGHHLDDRYSNRIEGSLDLMSMQANHVQGKVRCPYDTPHPVYAVLGYLGNLRQSERPMGELHSYMTFGRAEELMNVMARV